MLKWFFRSTKRLPSYSLLRAVPSRGLPQDLADREASSDYHQWRDRIECELVAQECDEDEANFLTFLKSGYGLLQMRLPQLQGGAYLPSLLHCGLPITPAWLRQNKRSRIFAQARSRSSLS